MGNMKFIWIFILIYNPDFNLVPGELVEEATESVHQKIKKSRNKSSSTSESSASTLLNPFALILFSALLLLA